MRSVWKGNYLNFYRNNIIHNSSSIFNFMVEKKIIIRAGKELKTLHVTHEMLGKKVGEFCFTRKVGFIHKLKKIKSKKKGFRRK